MTPILLPLPGNEEMARLLAGALRGEVGPAEFRHFPDGDSYVRIDWAVRGKPVILVCAVSGGTVDAALMPSTPTLKPVAAGAIKRIAWVGDITPGWMGSALFTRTSTANQRGDLVKRFLAAYRKGTSDYHGAFATADGKRQDGPDALAMLKLLSDFTGVPAKVIDQALPYIDGEGRVNIDDVAHQIEWYKAQGMLKGDLKAEQLIDLRYARTTK